MDINVLLNDAIDRLENMSVDEFEKECQKAGYNPVRKDVVSKDKTTPESTYSEDTSPSK